LYLCAKVEASVNKPVPLNHRAIIKANIEKLKDQLENKSTTATSAEAEPMVVDDDQAELDLPVEPPNASPRYSPIRREDSTPLVLSSGDLQMSTEAAQPDKDSLKDSASKLPPVKDSIKLHYDNDDDLLSDGY